MRRLERSRVPLMVWAALGVGFVVVVLFLGFFGTSSITGHPFQVHAIFRSESQIKPRAQVRIAGVAVGEVGSVQPVGQGSNAADVTLELNNDALPIHSDATVAIRSRLVFEGNYYVALDPGSPGAPQLNNGDTIGPDRTTGPVQLDRVLSALPTDTRNNLRTVLQGLGQTLTQTQNGETTGQALNESFQSSPQAFKGLAQVFEGLQGEQPNDLSNLVQGSNGFFTGLARSQSDLANLVSNFNRTTQAFASRQEDLSRSVALLDPVLHHAEQAFVQVERALPSTTALATQLIPGVRELPATISAMTPWLDEGTALLGPDEAGGLTKYVKPTVRNGAGLFRDLVPILNNLDSISRCWTHNIIPTGDQVIKDPPLPSGPTAAQEFFQGFTGITSATQNFDGNGKYARGMLPGGAIPIHTANLPGFGISHANAVLPPLGTRPAYTHQIPQLNFGKDCASNNVPDVNNVATGGTP